MNTYSGAIVGGIWGPPGAIYALDVDRFEAEDDEHAIDKLQGELAGDFSSVRDVEVWRHETAYETAPEERIVKQTLTKTLIKRFSEEAEMAYSDAMFGGEDDE